MANSTLDNTFLQFTTDGTTIAAQMTATADTLTLVGAAAADVLISGVDTPVSGTDAVNKDYVDNAINGLDWRESVVAGSAGANVDITTELENGDTLDGVTLATGDRVLLKDQTDGTENGIYIVAATGAAARSDDMATASNAAAAAMFIQEGTVNADTAYVCTNNEGSDVVGTDALVFVQFGGGAGTPGGADTQLQYNDGGSFGGAATITFDDTGNTSLTFADNASLILGTGSDFSMIHNATDTVFVSSTGQFLIDNANATGATNLRTGSDTAATSVTVQNSSAASLFSVAGSGLVTVSSGTLSGTPGTTGSHFVLDAQTFTDNNTAASGTATNFVSNSIAQPTLAATNATVTTTDAATLYIEGEPTAGTNQTITNAWALQVASGDVSIAGTCFADTFTTTSDAAVKTNFEYLDVETDPIATLMNIQGYAYDFREPEKRGYKRQWGVVAQQLEEAGLYNMVHNKGDHKSVNYQFLIPLLVEAVKQLKKNMDESNGVTPQADETIAADEDLERVD